LVQLAFLAMIGFLAAGSPASPAVRASCSEAHSVVLIDARTGAVNCTAPNPTHGFVNAAVADGGGGWFIGGSFRRVGSDARPLIAHLHGDGSVDPAFRAQVSLPGGGAIATLVRHGSVLYAGWSRAVAAFDARTGKQIWRTSIGGAVESTSGCCKGVSALTFGNGVLYVVGAYGRIGGVVRHGVAALDPRSGRPLSWTVDVNRSGEVLSVAVAADGTVYLAGAFDRLGGRRRHNLGAVSARTGRTTAWAPVVRPGGGAVDAMVIARAEVIIGGHSPQAAFDIRTGRPFAWPTQVGGSVAHFAVSASTVYLGGNARESFSRVGDRPANNLAAVRLPGGSFTTWTPSVNTEVGVQALAVSGNTVLAGGYFCPSLTAC